MRMILVVLAALCVAGGAGFYVMQGLRPTAPVLAAVEAPAPVATEVYTPSHQMPAGTIIAADGLSRMALPVDAVTEQMVVADAAGEKFLVGSVARQMLAEGVPIARSATVQPGDRGFLAAVLPKGKRAITIAVSETSGLNGLALPGDWVDLILTYSVVTEDDENGDSTGPKQRDIHASETVARNIRLLALDNRVDPEHKDDEGKIIAPPPPTSATLQVTPRQAEQIALASTLGALSLSLNSVRDGGEKVDEMADGLRPSPMEPVGLVKPALSRSAAAQGLDMTLDSDVTSLLRLEVRKVVPEQISRIQVVRGHGSALAETEPLKTADPADAAEPADPKGE